ncbi:MAG TPA: galactokinase [Gemmatimonadaceae bacterium]|nr:galactokinase [Gemmatimonadaceae bacterium]
MLALFARELGGVPEVVASAPGRVNLIGEHTDYNGGEVLPIAIGRRTWVAARRVSGATSRARSAAEELMGGWDPATPRRAGKWWDYLAGVQSALNARGALLGAVEMAVTSDVPAGSGLSSSAALEVAAMTALAELASLELSPGEIALESRRVEADFVGVSCGIMDQCASALSRSGSALHIWCDTARVEHVPLRDAVMIFDTGIPRALRASDFNARRADCEQALTLLRELEPDLPNLAAATPALLAVATLPAPLDRRARHVVEETARVGRVVERLRSEGTLDGDALYESHESLRTLYECSTAALDWFVARASKVHGIRGARLTGAGWGGCAIAVGDDGTLADAAPNMVADYRQRFGLEARAWVTRAESGARLESHAH